MDRYLIWRRFQRFAFLALLIVAAVQGQEGKEGETGTEKGKTDLQESGIAKELKAFLEGHMKLLEAQNVDAAIDNLHSKGMNREKSIADLRAKLTQLKFQFKISDARYIGSDGEYFYLRYKQRTVLDPQWAKATNAEEIEMDVMTIFAKENEKWKIFDTYMFSQTIIEAQGRPAGLIQPKEGSAKAAKEQAVKIEVKKGAVYESLDALLEKLPEESWSKATTESWMKDFRYVPNCILFIRKPVSRSRKNDYVFAGVGLDGRAHVIDVSSATVIGIAPMLDRAKNFAAIGLLDADKRVALKYSVGEDIRQVLGDSLPGIDSAAQPSSRVDKDKKVEKETPPSEPSVGP